MRTKEYERYKPFDQLFREVKRIDKAIRVLCVTYKKSRECKKKSCQTTHVAFCKFGKVYLNTLKRIDKIEAYALKKNSKFYIER